MATTGAKRWVEPVYNTEACDSLIREFGLQAATARILACRGILTTDSARTFLEPSTADLIDPFRLSGMDRAVSRIDRAVRSGERVVVYGDYDVDGITATALYLDYFKSRGLEAEFYIPHRLKEGYGLNESAIRILHDRGTSLLITADCGTTSVDEIRLASMLGMDVIVTDHHEASSELPPALALLNPKRADAGYPERGLCTAGLAFKVIQALAGHRKAVGLDLVALGTIADVSPMSGENRYLVKEGLKELTLGGRPGIRALKAAAGLEDGPVRTGTVGFTLAPRINASGRMGDAREAVRLLTTESAEEAAGIARSLNLLNRERQDIEDRILSEACARVESEVDLKSEGCVVLASREWHTGVVGIVAARLVEKYYRPTVMLSVDPDGWAKGSARSIPGCNIYEALRHCQGHLARFGGHGAAAGLTVRSESIPALRRDLSATVLGSLDPQDFQPKLTIDTRVDWAELSLRLVGELECLAPFGVANPEPTLLLKGVIPTGGRIVGNGHLKFRIRNPTATPGGAFGDSIDVIGFRMGDRLYELNGGSTIDLAFTPERNTWQGRERVQLRVKDLRKSQ